jgi:hypothetical protein
LHSQLVLRQRDLVCWLAKALIRDPALMHLGPGRLARIATVLAQQERLELLAHLQAHVHGVLARPPEIAQRLVGLVGHPDRLELARPGQLRQPER